MPDKAAELLGVKPKELIAFNEADPFNPSQRIAGFLCRRSDHRYGALVIQEVNEEPTEPQVVYCTPKLHYPFGIQDTGERQYRFPDTEEVRVYEKLDGTNICAFSYQDAQGNRYQTFKTRLTPLLRKNRFGDFLGLWQEVTSTYPSLLSVPRVLDGSYSLSFELYGYRNVITVKYPFPLKIRLLFGVCQETSSVIIPEGFQEDLPKELVLQAEATLQEGEDLVTLYEQMRSAAELLNRVDEEGLVQEGGTEGYIFYVQNAEDGKWKPFKNKPSSIETLHWVSDTIPRNRILPTVWNALESFDGDELTTEYICELLLEEFKPHMVEKSKERVGVCIRLVMDTVRFRERVLGKFEQITFPETLSKGDIMRKMSPYFEKREMKKVFSELFAMGGV